MGVKTDKGDELFGGTGIIGLGGEAMEEGQEIRRTLLADGGDALKLFELTGQGNMVAKELLDGGFNGGQFLR